MSDKEFKAMIIKTLTRLERVVEELSVTKCAPCFTRTGSYIETSTWEYMSEVLCGSKSDSEPVQHHEAAFLSWRMPSRARGTQ